MADARVGEASSIHAEEVGTVGADARVAEAIAVDSLTPQLTPSLVSCPEGSSPAAS